MSHLFPKKGGWSQNGKRVSHPPPNSPLRGFNPFFVQNSQKIIDWICMLGRVTIGFFAHGPDNKLDSHTITKFALPQKIFGPIVQRIKKVELPALSPQNSDSMVLSPTRLPRSNPLSYMRALPSGWDNPHLTEKWAQETGSGTCLIYMESCNEVTRKNEMN